MTDHDDTPSRPEATSGKSPAEAPVSTVPGAYLRFRPSGYVHCLEWVERARSGVREADVFIMRCGRKRRRLMVTDEFPPLAARCPVCFVPAPANDTAARS